MKKQFFKMSAFALILGFSYFLIEPSIVEAVGQTTAQGSKLIIGTPGGGQSTDLQSLVGDIYKWAVTAVMAISVITIIFGGIEIATAGGNPDGASSGKAKIFRALSAVALILLVGFILNTINPDYFS